MHIVQGGIWDEAAVDSVTYPCTECDEVMSAKSPKIIIIDLPKLQVVTLAKELNPRSRCALGNVFSWNE